MARLALKGLGAAHPGRISFFTGAHGMKHAGVQRAGPEPRQESFL